MISVIVPIYNVSEYIIDCLKSIVSQTYKDLEVILIDDCGYDDSIEKCNMFISEYNGDIKFRLVKHEKNSGLSASRNTGIECAEGQYIYFLDSDDIIMPDALSSLYDAIQTGDYAIAIGYFTAFVNGGPSVYRNDWLYNQISIIEPYDFADLSLSETINHASTAKLYKRDILKDIRFAVGKKNEDKLFLLELYPIIESNNFRCINVPNYSYYYRQRQGSITNALSTQRPFYMDVVENGEEIINRCALSKPTIVQAVREKNLTAIFVVAKTLLFSFPNMEKEYYDYCKKLSSYKKSELKKKLSTANYLYARLFVSYSHSLWFIINKVLFFPKFKTMVKKVISR